MSLHVTPDWDAPKQKAGYVASPQGVVDEASKYNEWLFAPKKSEKGAADKMYALLRKRQLTAAMRKTLDAELEEKEVRAAIRGMAAGKSPGPDKLGAEFYKEFEDLVAGDLLSMLKEAVKVGYFHGLFSRHPY